LSDTSFALLAGAQAKEVFPFPGRLDLNRSFGGLLMVGTTVSHYKILEYLGGGGMGVVYKAQDLKLDRLVALKFLPPDLTRDPEAKQRFVHEAKAASSLDHPNICNVHEIDETSEGQIFISMAYYEGETLKKMIERGPLEISDAVEIASQVARGLAKAHEHGIVHRDIKPANIIITADGIAKIVDFGLAKLSGQTLLTKTGTTLGTAAYMSPEQARNEAVDARTDIWSLGIVLYEMITGRRPFASAYEQAMVYSILNTDPKPLRALRPHVPEALEKIARRAMAKDPKDRYKNASELLSDLESYKAGFQVSQRTRKIRVRKRKVLYAGLVVVALAAGIIVIFRFASRGEVFDRVAVLPFHNISKDSAQEWLSDGMTEEVIAKLQQVASLTVPSFRGMLPYKNSKASYADIAHELHAKAIVDASILSVNNHVRVMARLVDPATDRSLWSETYDGHIEDVLDLQTKIARALVKAVRVEVTPGEAGRLAQFHKVDTKAYELYLKARQAWYIGTPNEQEYETALNTLERAIAIDSSYPPMCSLAAMMYQDASVRGYCTTAEILPSMQRAVDLAMLIDDQDSDTQLALALLSIAKWDWDGAESALRRALAVSPRHAETRHIHSRLLLCLGKSEEAFAEFNRAREIDPSIDVHGLLTVDFLVMTRRFDEAIRIAVDSLQHYSDDASLHEFLAYAYAAKGMCDSADIHNVKSIRLTPSAGEAFIDLNCAQNYTLCGERQRGYDLLNHYLAVRQGKLIEPYWVASTYALLDDTKKAYSWLEKAYRERSQTFQLFKIDICWDSQHSDPRYLAMLKRVGLDK